MISGGRLARARASLESLHTDTFTVYRPTGQKVTDPDTWEEVDEYTTELTGIKGKFQARASQDSEAQAPGMKVAETVIQWHTSIGTVGVLTDDVVECTASVHDPALVGRRARITGPAVKSIATARRFNVEITS